MGITAGTVGDTSAPGPLGRIEGAVWMTHEAGQNATRYTDGLGVRLPADSSLAWRAQVSSFGEQVVVRIDVGFTFHPTGYTPRYTAPGPGMACRGSSFDNARGPDDRVNGCRRQRTIASRESLRRIAVTNRVRGAVSVSGAVVVGLFWVTEPAMGQARPPWPGVDETWTAPRTPWGVPELTGIWDSKSSTRCSGRRSTATESS